MVQEPVQGLVLLNLATPLIKWLPLHGTILLGAKAQEKAGWGGLQDASVVNHL